MVQATISADIVSSTALSVEELTLLQLEIRQFLENLSDKSEGKDWGRLFKGDSVEIFLLDPHEAFRTALLLKTLVKKTIMELLSDRDQNIAEINQDALYANTTGQDFRDKVQE